MTYNDLNIRFSIENIDFYALNIAFEHITEPFPSHSHSKNSYEIHFIPYGSGKLIVNHTCYEITANSLYVTGPFIEHEQIPSKEDPMTEYCIYLKLNKLNSNKGNDLSIIELFEQNEFWFGEDNQNYHELMQQIFLELDKHYTGYITALEALLKQAIVKLVRNYENNKINDSKRISVIQSSGKYIPSTNLYDKYYLIIEDSFLYGYQDITLDKLAFRLGLSNRQTERLLKSQYNKTFLQKKIEARMSAATTLLRDNKRSITSIAFDLGYSSVEHFSNAFKRYYHVTASAFRHTLDN